MEKLIPLVHLNDRTSFLSSRLLDVLLKHNTLLHYYQSHLPFKLYFKEIYYITLNIILRSFLEFNHTYSVIISLLVSPDFLNTM
ncbi:10K protein [Mirafiori lettuce big-vein virus]|uniref:Uncharacterized 10 kDa protein n=1 Tax=Mirafiori lettuce virus (isolate Lettuce/Netherlands/LS301-O) TaxID=652964 RepID=VG10_MILVL|nr:RecName: Full=Uncharacterized 10 kDa protein [Mirafiori lettuce virus LS301-O]AAN60451.1 10K protein [Mirafiori lettuce big-vein virus]